MVEALLIPDRRVFRIEARSTRLGDLLKLMGLDMDEAAVIINGVLVEDPDYIVREGDSVKVVRVGTGG